VHPIFSMYKDVQWKIDLVMKATFSTSALFQMCVLASALAACRENDPRLFNFVLALFIAAYAATLFGTLLILAWAVRKMGFLMRRVSRKDDNGVANPIIDKMNRVLYTGLTTGIPVVLIVVVFFVVPLVVGSLPYFYVLWYGHCGVPHVSGSGFDSLCNGDQAATIAQVDSSRLGSKVGDRVPAE